MECAMKIKYIYMLLFVHKKWYRLEICTVCYVRGEKLERPQRKNCHTFHLHKDLDIIIVTQTIIFFILSQSFIFNPLNRESIQDLVFSVKLQFKRPPVQKLCILPPKVTCIEHMGIFSQCQMLDTRSYSNSIYFIFSAEWQNLIRPLLEFLLRIIVRTCFLWTDIYTKKYLQLSII